jgi:hypothetical protein
MDLDVMLCDHAQVAGDKLFISGANIDRMQLPAGSQPPYIVNFAAAGLIRVPWTATNNEHGLAFNLVTEDGQVPTLAEGIEPGPGGIGGEMRFNVGRPPQLTSGEEQMVPFAFNFQGLPLGAAGRYVVQFSIDGTESRRLPFSVTVQPPTGFPGPAALPRL